MNISKIHTYNIYADISCTYLHMIAYLRPTCLNLKTSSFIYKNFSLLKTNSIMSDYQS